MNEIVITPEGTAIKVENDDEYMDSCNKVSEYISSLPLTAEQNNTLVAMLTENQRIGRKSAFMQGVKTYAELASVLLNRSDFPLN